MKKLNKLKNASGSILQKICKFRPLVLSLLFIPNIGNTQDSNPTQTTAKALGINTELNHAHQTVSKPKDVNIVLEEQNALREAMAQVSKAAETYSRRQADSLNKEADELAKQGKEQEAAQKRTEAESWQTSGANKRKVEAVTTAITMATAGKPAEAIAVGAASPYVNQAIKDITKESETTNIAAHVLWGAIEAELSGNKAQTGAIAAATAELGARALTQAVYNKAPEDLTPTEKATVLEISKAMAGVAVGVADGGNAASVLTSVKTAADVAERAVENNYLSKANWQNYEKDIQNCNSNQECIERVKDKFSEINKQNSLALKNACQLGGSTEACAEHTSAAQEGFNYARSNIQFDGSGWMAGIMRISKEEAKSKPTLGLLGSETISYIEKSLSDSAIRNRLENDPKKKEDLTNLIDQAAKAVRTEKGNAYEFGARMEYPNIATFSNNYTVFGQELGLEPVVPEYYAYSLLNAGKIGKNLFNLSSTSTRWIVGTNGAVSAGAQYLTDGEISVKTTAKDMVEAYVTKDFGFKTYTAWNLGAGFLEGSLENAKWQGGRLQGFSIENGLERASVKTVTSSLGYGIGKGVERPLDKRINTYGNSLRTEPIRIGSPISKFVEASHLPIGIGNILDSSMSKSLETIWDNYEILNGGKNENPSK